jgi:hypothetical protein
LGLLLGRFGDEVGGVTLRLSTTARPDGKSDNRCQIAIALKPKGVRVESIDTDPVVAFERAADKAVRSISRMLSRDRDPANSAAALGALEAARVLAADRVLGTASRTLRSLMTPEAARKLEAARAAAAAKVLKTAGALEAPLTPQGARLQENARVLAAERVLETARAVKREGKKKAVKGSRNKR